MDANSLSFCIKYKAAGKKYVSRSAKCEHFSLKYDFDDGTLNVTVAPNEKVEFLSFDIVMPYKFAQSDRIFVNGYQSWTDSLEYAPDGKMSELKKTVERFIKSPIGRKIGLSKSGDSLFWKYPRKAGIFYGWSYGYARRGDRIDLFGSLNERYGYTVVSFDCNADTVTVSKELEGVTFGEEKKVLELYVASGDYEQVFDSYFKRMNVSPRESKKMVGYTSWYNYYSHISEEIIRRDLQSIASQDIKFDCFQVDDGYQRAIGDWLIADSKKFPNGMKAVADGIHAHGMLAGLWLAPFAATKNSLIFQEHKDWFIKGKFNRPYNTGPNWGGFYSLDIYNSEARKYLKRVFDVVLNEWGYDLVKLDFLYGACVRPMYNKSRGEIMCDAIDLLRECCGDKLILGCGTPLMPAFGKVDYCRIGADVSLSWKNVSNTIREDVSTPHAVCNSIFRRHLDGRAWNNDPDVFLLRDRNMFMTFEKRKLLAKINSLFGSLLFISDDVSEYDEEKKATLKQTFEDRDVKILSAEFVEEDIMQVRYRENGDEKILKFNVRNGEEYR